MSQVALHLDQCATQRCPNDLREALSALKLKRRKLAQFLRIAAQQFDNSANQGPTLRAARKEISRANTRLRHANRVEAVVDQQIAPKRHALVAPDNPKSRGPDVMDRVVMLFLDAVHQLANPMAHTQSRSASDQGFHRDIPWPMHPFTKLIGAARRICLAQRKSGVLRFLDVGSGGGTKVLAASACFDVCDGLEFERDAVDAGSALFAALDQTQCQLFHGDALKSAKLQKSLEDLFQDSEINCIISP